MRTGFPGLSACVVWLIACLCAVHGDSDLWNEAYPYTSLQPLSDRSVVIAADLTGGIAHGSREVTLSRHVSLSQFGGIIWTIRTAKQQKDRNCKNNRCVTVTEVTLDTRSGCNHGLSVTAIAAMAKSRAGKFMRPYTGFTFHRGFLGGM